MQSIPNLRTFGGYQYVISSVSMFTSLLYVAFIFCEKRLLILHTSTVGKYLSDGGWPVVDAHNWLQHVVYRDDKSTLISVKLLTVNEC